MLCGQRVVTPRESRHALRSPFSDGHVRDAGILLCEGCASSQFEDVFWRRFGSQCAHADVRHVNDEGNEAVGRRLGRPVGSRHCRCRERRLRDDLHLWLAP